MNKLEKIKSMLTGSYSKEYWEARYRDGGDSGAGSYGEFAEYKASFLTRFFKENSVESVVEFGCGDGNQTQYWDIGSYLGVDVSATAVSICQKRYRSDPRKRFILESEYNGEQGEVSMSLDVIYHLVEDRVYFKYMSNLCSAASRWVVVYSSNSNELAGYKTIKHVRHRRFSDYMDQEQADLQLIIHEKNPMAWSPQTGLGTFADFYVYERR